METFEVVDGELAVTRIVPTYKIVRALKRAELKLAADTATVKDLKAKLAAIRAAADDIT